MLIRYILLFLVTICCSTTALAAQLLANPRTMNFAPLEFRIPKAERVLLENGIPVYLMQDSELPIVSVSALIRTGSVYDPEGKSGVATLTGSQMREGGTRSLAPAALDDELEFMASSVESSFSKDIGTVSCSSLTRNLERTLQLFSEVLLYPAFDSKRFNISKQQAFEILRRQNDDPKEVGDRELTRAIYAGHPLGIFPDMASVKAITREDLISFHRRFVRPDTMILAISGDFDRKSLLKSLNRLIGSVKPEGKLDLPVIQDPNLQFVPELLYAPKKINQSVIRMGHLGIKKDDPDLYAIRVLDFILGGSFSSRLTMEIRTNQGLAYNVGSSFEVGRRFTGLFTAETETRSGATARTIGQMISIISSVQKAAVTEQELKLAKDSIMNSFLFGFTTPASVVVQQARLEFYGYEPDFLDRYRERIGAVTREDLLCAARKHLHPEAFKLVVVGDKDQFDKPLSNFGKVTTLELK